MGKTNFDRITASPEALASFLASLPCLDAPWDDDFHRIFRGGGGNSDRQPCPCPGVHPERVDRPPVPEMLLFQCRCDRSDGSDGNKHDDSAVRIMRTALSSWLTKVNPQLCRGQKNSFRRGVKQTEKKLPIIAEVVCRPHNYDNEEVSLVKEAQARPSEMLDDILMPKPRLLREKA